MPAHTRHRSRGLLLAVALGAWSATAWAASGADATARKEELRALRGRIQTLEKDLTRSEHSRGAVRESLRETEAAVVAANARLRGLAAERTAAEAALRRSEDGAARLAARIGDQERRLERLLRHQFMGGESEALRLLLAGRDPNEAARDAWFLRQLSRARAEMIGELRAARQEQAALAAEAGERREALVRIEAGEAAARSQLLESQRLRQQALAELSGRIQAQKRAIETLRQDEQRLGALIRRLAAASVRAPAVRPDRAPARREAPASRRPAAPEPPAAGRFAALKGRLVPPARGEVAGRYGTPRPEGGTTWKGLFIRAPEGGEVKAVAEGRVVFADWMRGFGHLIVVDHDDGFLSVYGNNRNLVRSNGDAVRAGEVLAAVGNSGGGPETGLYFELRYQGQPIDPARWVGFR
ncbi:MAG: peptidoglycan DD-metalloendopeptidase family protein [Rhodocyclaceae bacterium]|nr:peptidoglycan DD-metalloendopeptidase family protein [Rhodocyclaceae bacterium]